jgi:hypothetical protein
VRAAAAIPDHHAHPPAVITVQHPTGRVAPTVEERHFKSDRKEVRMVALIVLLLIVAVFGGLGFAVHVLWFVLIAALILWVLGFLVGGAKSGRRRWYGRW